MGKANGGMRALPTTRLSLLVLVLTSLVACGAEPRRVLLIHSLGRDFAPYDSFSAAFRTELASQSPEPLDLFEASLDSARFAQSPQEGPLVEYLRAQFAEQRLDLVVSIGGPAAQFAQRHRPQLFPTTPMLIAAADQRLLDRTTLGPNDTAVAVLNDLAQTMKTILRVLPNTTNVVVVIGKSPLERFWSGEIRREFQPFTNRVTLVWFNELPFSEVIKRCAALPQGSAIYFPLLCVDAAGVPHLEERALTRLHEVANAPIFGIRDSQLGLGIVGGPLTAIEELSRDAAKAAVRILRGEKPREVRIPPQVLGPPQFDWRELKRWGISDALLPAGSAIRFRQPTAWELYKGRIIAVSSLCLVESVLILLLIRNLVNRRRVERALRESEERLSLAAAAGDVGVWVWNIRRDRIWATDNWLRMFGFTAETTIHYETFLQRVHPKDRPKVERAVQRAVDDRTHYVSEHRVVLPDSAVRWIAAHGRFHSGANAKQPRLLGASVDITERKRAEEAARDLSGRLLDAQEDERARLAKELHDGLSQNLALLSVEMEMLGRQLPETPGQINARLEEFSRQAKGLSADVHRISHGLHPAKLTQLGLAVALKGFCREVEMAHGIAVRFEAHDVPRVLPEDVALCLYRVGQEAIQNVVKHSHAKNAKLELVAVDDAIKLSVTDDGRGFEMGAERATSTLGLVSMQERVRLVQGEIAVKSKLGEGTCVEAFVPLAKGPVA
jgi:PAS domain S-box-containing protein